jgi:carbamoyl-phosphate synthase large subunit
MLKRLLITGAGGPASTNFISSLKISPEKMFIVGIEHNDHNFHLVQTDKKYLIPRANSVNYVKKLNEIIEKEKITFVHPQPDIEVYVIGKNRHEIKANTFLPSQDTIRICQDKFLSTKVWKKKGIPIAKVQELKHEKDVKRAFSKLGNRLWIRAKHGAGGRGSTIATNTETALAWTKYWKNRNKNMEFIAQELLVGRNIGFHSLFKEGELVTSMARERIEYIYPHLTPSGITGTPSVQRTIHDKEVNEIGEKAVLAIDPEYDGIACVDLKEDKEGVPCPTEINAGRMFTTSFFFSFAGAELFAECGMPKYFANIPYLYIKLAYDEDIPKIPKQNILPKNLYWIRHIDSGARLVRNGKVIGVWGK